MIKAMQSAIAGLRTHQTKMDVIGNNIANVNTWGYKGKSANFADMMYQNYITGSAGEQTDGALGGVNTSQIGFGAQVSSIVSDFTVGGRSYTGRPFDCMIDGSGFFIVGGYSNAGFPQGDASNPYGIKNNGLSVSRVGIFQSPGGYLTDDQGNYVYGYAADTTNTSHQVPNPNPPGGFTDVTHDYYDPNYARPDTATLVPINLNAGLAADGSESYSSYTIGKDGVIVGTVKGTDEQRIVGYIALATVQNTAGLEQSSGYLYSFGRNVGDISVGQPDTGSGFVIANNLEMPTVDLATEVSQMITTQRGYQANTKIITVTDQMLEDLVNMKR